MSATEVLLALLIAVGLVGIVVPVLPGSGLVLVAILVWAWSVGGTTAWLFATAGAALLVAGSVVKYVVPGRRLQMAGVPASTQWVGVALGLVGFFVVPVVGLLLGFVLGVYLAEVRRIGAGRAWPSTVHSLKAAGLSIAIELAAAMLAALVWAAGVVAT